MARLNEPSAPIESIESLKRKFMRQNRDIARANSTQSLRIRNLENETSRLLSENLGLREQIIHLQNELEDSNAQRIADGTGAIKSQLEAKLLEIGNLISSLGDGPAPKKKSSREGKVTKASPSQSPNQRDWKNMCTLSEAVAGQEGRLPSILENKSYPRKTLEKQEIVDLVADAAQDSIESPDIGPPPVSQFVNEDPVKIDLPTRAKKVMHDDIPGIDSTQSVNLEQRRKRRDSSSSSEPRRPSKAEPAPATQDNLGSLKVGAKRKLSVREDEEYETITRPAEASLDEFKFTRAASEERQKTKAAPQAEKLGNRVKKELAVARGVPREKPAPSIAPTSRKALASKSVNDSPKKSTRAPFLDEVKAAKAEILKINPSIERNREKRHEPVPINTRPSERLPIQSVEIQSEPETPAGLDIFSPLSSQPSTARAETQDTPPPLDLGPGLEGQRPSRRARAAVSYAEPSLRDKMRRPGKELVDAVFACAKSSHPSTIKAEDLDTSTLLRIKPEPEANDAWKSMPIASSASVDTSPLSNKHSGSDKLPASITTHRKRRESILAENDIPRTNSASAVAALLAGNRRIKAEAQDKSLQNASVPGKSSLAGPDIYDFRGSSPVPAEEAIVEPARIEKSASRFSRRHSAIPPRDIPPVCDSESSDHEGSKKNDFSKTRRRQSTLGTRNGSSASTEFSKEDEAERILKKASSTIGLSSSSAEKSDRTSARRRSMML